MKSQTTIIGTFVAIVLGSMPLLAQDAEKDKPAELEFTLTVSSNTEVPDFGTFSRRVTVGEAETRGLAVESGFFI